ncbi:MAG: class I SAM-dependent methyltransferase [Gammaproteobacteria bacterium]
MNDPSKECFDHYLQTYMRYSGKRFLPLSEIRALHLDRLPRWINRIPIDARILDVGCATGYLLSLLQEMGFQNLTGVDLSEDLAAFAREHLPESVPIHKSDIRDFLAQKPEGAYDVIFFHHVLEHIPREGTINLLREFRRCLAKDGLLNLKTPNASCLLAGYGCFGDFTHVTFFNEYSLVQVLERAGFESEAITFVRHSPSLIWSSRHPVRMLRRGLNRLRWHLNNWIHRAVCILLDLNPRPRVFDIELDALIRK